MTFLREKRMLLGLLALVAPLPLPFNEPRPEGVVGLPFLFVYSLFVVFFLFRASRNAVRWLGPAPLNLLALAYLPFLYADLVVLYSGHLVRPMMHLALFALVAKLFSIERERDKWHVFVGVFFVFLTSMATSAGPGIIVYLLVFLALAIAVLSRFSMFHVRTLSGESAVRTVLGTRHQRPALVWLTMFTVLVSVPLFVFLPRLRDPYILGAGASPGGTGFATGFSDEANLDLIGSVRNNDAVALRAQLEGGRQSVDELRLKAVSYDRYSDKRWLRSDRARWRRLGQTQGSFRLSEKRPERFLHIWLQPLGSLALVGPAETRAAQFMTPAPAYLATGPGGSVFLPAPPTSVTEYQLGLGAPGVPELTAEPAPDTEIDLGGITSEIAALASAVAVGASPLDRIRAVERYLSTEYAYSLDLLGFPAEHPIEHFLLRSRSGHCEYFASAMVLMLRSQGIHARYVTGFLGGEYNPLEGYYVIRQNNAHAWVEAYVPGQGWRVFDPTPAAGRPGAFERSLLTFARQAYDWVQFRWDRYVISYGADDQKRLLRELVQFWSSLWERSDDEEVPPADAPEVAASAASRDPWPILGPVLLVALALGLWIFVRRSRRLSATVAYLRLKRLAGKRGIEAGASVSVEDFQSGLVEKYPDSRAASEKLVAFYLRESYREDELSDAENLEVARLYRSVSRELKRAS